MIIISNWTKLPEGCYNCPFAGEVEGECLASVNTLDDYENLKYVNKYLNFHYRNERAPFCPLKEETK